MCLLVTILLLSIQNHQFLNTNSYHKPELPNIIFILADDLGIGDLSCYNEMSKIPTPNLDAIAEEGIMFTDAHTSSSVCTPTRYGIMTGRYNWRSPLKQSVLTGKSKALLPPGRKTIAHLLKESGYHTAFFGKWHLGMDWEKIEGIERKGAGWDAVDFDDIDFSKPVKNGPKEAGFDYSFVHPASLDMAPYVYLENGICTMLPDTVSVDTSKYGWWRKGPTSRDFSHQEVSPKLFELSSEYVKEKRDNNQPFFLFLSLPSPHTPILPNEKWKGKSKLNPYGDFVMMIDDLVGELLEKIELAGMKENTMIIFTSDNGCSPAANIALLNEKGHFPSHIYRGHKADIYEGGHRVPFIVRWPNKIQKTRKEERIICTTDLYTTFSEICGHQIAGNEGEDGFSFLYMLEEKKPEKEIRESIIHHSIEGNFSIREGDWKLILCSHSGGWSEPRPQKNNQGLKQYQLYNLKEDPAEKFNLVEKHPDKVEILQNQLLSIIENGRSNKGKAQANDPVEKEWKQLIEIKNKANE